MSAHKKQTMPFWKPFAFQLTNHLLFIGFFLFAIYSLFCSSAHAHPCLAHQQSKFLTSDGNGAMYSIGSANLRSIFFGLASLHIMPIQSPSQPINQHQTVLGLQQRLAAQVTLNNSLASNNERLLLQKNELEEKLTAAEKAKEEQKELDECSVCLEMQCSHVISPCGHYCLCSDCATHFSVGDLCPICRGKIVQLIRIYK